MTGRNSFRFQSDWLHKTEFKGWLVRIKDGENDAAFCKLCNKRLMCHKPVLSRHLNTNFHKAAAAAIKSTPNITIALNSSNSNKEAVKRAELKIVGLLATNNLAFRLVDDLVPILKSSFQDSDILKQVSLHRTKATALMKNVLGPDFSQELYTKLKNTVFSIIIDETTDISTTKQIAFTVIFYNDDTSSIQYSFFDFKECESSTAKDIFNLLKSTITEKGIPFQNLVGFASDTPNVMFGQYNSVAKFLKNEKPDIAVIKCSCHLIHLVASKACLKLPTYLEDLLRNLGSYFNRSYIRQKKLEEFQEYFQTGVHKILSPAITRWLSIHCCVKRVLEQFEPLRSFLRLEVFEDPSKVTETMLHSLDDPKTKIYFEFLSYALGILVSFNVLFQSEKPILYKMKNEVINILQTYYSNYIKMDVLKSKCIWQINESDENLFSSLNDIYIGVAAYESLSQISTTEKTIILQNCREFYIEAIHQIKSRFDFSDPIYSIVDIVNPKNAQNFEPKSLTLFTKRFPLFDIDLQQLDNEWRQNALLDIVKFELNGSLEPEAYWLKVFKLKNSLGDSLFPNLQKVINFILILPFSNASAERIFSNLKNCKTDLRNKMSSETLASIFFTNEGIRRNGNENYEPSQEMCKKKWKF
ncbi:uncharacterized protein LOC135963040 [Calliphora vicina]|uniref:uncharacterized protein LOC135963040 n=1 Tax=Calliphora vicina TaxID=7373 RepID=UPI00325B4A39